jgi:hypothetical protein
MAPMDTMIWLPQSQAERDAISAQLEKLLSHPAFKNSKRCPALLRYTVEHELQGNTSKLKERTLGVEVFGRESDYDTNSDPVVRTTAGDIRKRIAQYYHEPGHEGEIRIELPSGSYVPEFHLPDGQIAELALSVDVPLVSVPQPVSPKPHTKNWQRYAISGCLVLGLITAIGWRARIQTASSLDEFWKPVTSSGPTLLCVGTWAVSSISSDVPPSQTTNLDHTDLLPITDAVAFSRIAGYLGETRAPYRVEGARTTTLTDLIRGPVVVVGALDNPWTMRITDALRFHFVHESAMSRWSIADRKDASKLYTADGDATNGGAKQYALIGRVTNGTSGQISVVVAGLGAAGTTAASEFVTDARFMDELVRQASKGMKSKNLEAVISVQVIDGKPGAPQVEAVEVW